MKIVAIIPARMAAKRYPGKPLEKLSGIPMIGHCYFRTAIAFGKKQTFAATCDQSIVNYIATIGGNSVYTSSSHNRATARTAEAVIHIEEQTQVEIDIVVMVQGDEPLVCPNVLRGLGGYFDDPEVSIVNIMTKVRDNTDFKDKNNVKVVVNKKNDALYFSREPIPSGWDDSIQEAAYIQTGIIAFRRKTLLEFNKMDETMLERLESVDMNRIIEMGNKIRMVPTEKFFIGVDTPEDLREAELLMQIDPTFASYSNL